jgi:hypothetical protein
VADRGLPSSPPPSAPAPTPAQQRYAQLKQDQIDALSNGQSVSEYRQVNALTSQFAANPAKWDATRRALGLPADAPMTSDNVTTALRLSRQLDAAGRQAGDAAALQRELQLERDLLRSPAVAARAQREIDVARDTAAYRAQLEVLSGAGRLQAPPGVDPARWMDRQAALVGAEQRARGDALARGQDPNEAAQRSPELYRMRLEAALDSGSLQQPLSPEQRQQVIDRQMQYHGEAVDLARKLGIPMSDAMGRIQTAHGLIDQRVHGQLQVEAAVQQFNNTTTAVTRGIERIRGFFGGDGAYNLDQARADFANIEAMQSEYNRLLLDNKTLTPEQQARRLQLEQQIPQAISAATSQAVGQIESSTQFANNSRWVEQGLWQTVFLGSAVIPGGPAIAALAKLGLDDLPNGRIRADSAAHFGQDVTTSLVQGAGAVYLNKLGLGGAGPGTMALASAAYSGGSSLLEQARDPSGQGIDGGRVLLDAGTGLLGGLAGGYAGRLPGLVPGAAGRVLQSSAGRFGSDRVVDLLGGTGLSAIEQLATTGQVDPSRALRSGVENAVLGGLDFAAQQGLQSRVPPTRATDGKTTPAVPAGVQPATDILPPASGKTTPLDPAEVQHATDILGTTARRAAHLQAQQELLGPFTPSSTAIELQDMRGQVAKLKEQLGGAGMDPSTPAGRQALREAWGGGPEADQWLDALDRMPGDMPWTPRPESSAGEQTPEAQHRALIDAYNKANAAYDQWAADQIRGGKFDLEPVLDRIDADMNRARDSLAQQGFDPAQHPQGEFQPTTPLQPRTAAERRDLEAHTSQLLATHVRRLEILRSQQEAMGVRAPSSMDVAIRHELAEIERNRTQLEAIGAPVPPELQPVVQGLPRGAAAFSPWDPEFIGSRVAGARDPEQAAHDLAIYELQRQHLGYYLALPDRIAQSLSGAPQAAAPAAIPPQRSAMSWQLGLPSNEAEPALSRQTAQLQQEVRNLLRVALAAR